MNLVKKCVQTVSLSVCFAGAASAAIIDLGHPTLTPFTSQAITSDATDRNVVFDATSAFGVDSIGIRFDPLSGGATTLRVDIHAVTLTGGVGTRGALLATAQTTITDLGFAFYDVPINFSFVAGQRYDVGLLPVPPEIWGNTGINSMEFYDFNYPTAAYSVGGLLSVIDGGRSGLPDGTGGGYTNGVMPHVRFNTAVIPEPGTLALLGLGLAGLAASRRRKQ